MEAQDIVNAVIAQRDKAMNDVAQLHASLAQAQRSLAEKDARIAELERQVGATPAVNAESPTGNRE